MEGQKKRGRGGTIAFVIVLCLLVGAVLISYYKIMKRQQIRQADQTPKTETEKLIAKDIEAGYPETPAEVLKLWGRINQSIYNNSLTDEQFSSLVKQLRVLYSSDLLASNDEAAQIQKFRLETEEFQEEKSKIVSYSAGSKATQYKSINHRECAYLKLSYFINKKKGYTKNFQDFILVKEDGKWKVLGFKNGRE